MEDPRFHLTRRYDELDTGGIVWVCQIEPGTTMKRLIKRLLLDLPQSRVTGGRPGLNGLIRYVIDTPREN